MEKIDIIILIGLLEWGIFVGIISSFGFWNLLIQPIAVLFGIGLVRVIQENKQK